MFFCHLCLKIKTMFLCYFCLKTFSSVIYVKISFPIVLALKKTRFYFAVSAICRIFAI